MPVNPRADESASVRATRERILDTAERHFATYGFSGTSLRALTEEAEVNLAAVNYHFGSKEALYEQVFVRRVAPMNARVLKPPRRRRSPSFTSSSTVSRNAS